MPRIHLCFLWHMHQPFYKNLVTGEYRLPWVRLHALKDYFGMVKILDEFPEIQQTFNLVPSLLIQIEDYAAGTAKDPFLDAALRPAESLDRREKEFILAYFFQANEDHVIRRYPRYGELFDAFRRHDRNAQRAVESFDTAMIRDLQVLSQVAWFDEYDLQTNPALRRLAAKGRNFDVSDQETVAAHERAAMGRVLDVYREAAKRGQIELSASPYYHPILPLLCDSNIANVSHPYISLPTQFAYPQDAEDQLSRSRRYFEEKFGLAPAGMWPSEGAISDQTLAIAAKTGFRWTASDDALLARTLDLTVAGEAAYQPYRWRQNDAAIDIVFRDRRLSDLIALAYPGIDPQQAAEHFLGEVRRNCAAVLESGRDAFVPIILDGENAWESYPENGRPFLRALYSRISEAEDIRAMKMSDGIRSVPHSELSHVFPGSWIDANFDIWIGSEEDNGAWDHLSRARIKLDEASQNSSADSESSRQAAREEILIAEGSDWCWWYGPEHSTANQSEFDQLYRDHLSNAYRCLYLDVPPELGVPISAAFQAQRHEAPSGLIQPHIDGLLTSQREWMHAGHYRIEPRTATPHAQRPLLQSLRYGSDGQNMYFRVDLAQPASERDDLEFVLNLRTASGRSFEIRSGGSDDLPESSFRVASREIYEARVSMSALHVRLGDPVFIRFTALRQGLPVGSIPQSGELELYSGSLAAYAY